MRSSNLALGAVAMTFAFGAAAQTRDSAPENRSIVVAEASRASPTDNKNAEDIEFLVTDTEKEALILENTLIKEHKPRFNVNFRDDKTYVNLRLDPRDKYPRLTVVRRPGRDGALYFGPYASSNAVRETLRTLSRIFPLRLCTDHVFNSRTRPCLYHQIHRCSAPCVPGHVSDEEYRALVEQTALFLRGRDEELLKMLYAQMRDASEGLRFEEAGRIYRRIGAIERTVERQKVTSGQEGDQDVFGFFREADNVEIQRLTIRGGKLLGGKSDLFTGQLSPDADILESYINQYYAEGQDIPEEVLLPHRRELVDHREVRAVVARVGVDQPHQDGISTTPPPGTRSERRRSGPDCSTPPKRRRCNTPRRTAGNAAG